MRGSTSRRLAGLTASVAVAALAASACSGDSTGTAEGGQAANKQATADNNLAGTCPATVVIQTDWLPQAEYGGLYRLLGEKPTIDKNKKIVTGKLVDNGTDTGVKIELRSGGPADNYTPGSSILFTDKSVMLGGSDADQIAQFSAKQSVKAVFAPMDLSPLVLMWNPQAYPGFNTIADIGQTNTSVTYFKGSTYMDYLLGAGLLRSKQVQPIYDGTDANWVSKQGKIVQQGYLTNEVYSYQNEDPKWKKPVKYQLISDTGYSTYPETLTVRTDREQEFAPCLKKLVPIMQRSTVAYLADPKPTSTFLSSLVDDFGDMVGPYSVERAQYAATEMAKEGIMGNGTNGYVGDFDTARMQKLFDIIVPIFAGQRAPVKPGLKASDLYTNAYIDQSVGTKS